MDDYLAMPEDVSRTVEIKDGMIVFYESPSPNHNAISRTIERALADGERKRADRQPCLRVNRDIDMLVSEVPFHYKRPDAIVYRCIEQPRHRWKTKPTITDTILVVEVVSPTTVTADTIDQRAEYARFVSNGHRNRTDNYAAAIDTLTPFETRITGEELDEGLD